MAVTSVKSYKMDSKDKNSSNLSQRSATGNSVKWVLVLVAFFSIIFLHGTTATAQTFPRVFCANPRVLMESKAKFVAHDPSLKHVFDRLLDDADRALDAQPLSVM